MTRIHVLSDLHCEFGAFEPPQDIQADITVLAGDTSTTGRLHPWHDASKVFGRPVLAIAGNHDFYGESIEGGLIRLRNAGAERGAIFLEDDVFICCGVRFLGCTLWTDFRIASDSERSRDWDRAVCADRVNDFRTIAVEGHRRFTPAHAAAIHARSLAWLTGMLEMSFEGPTVVITHHPPSARCLNPVYGLDSISAAFASNLEPLIERFQPELWISGHTHYCVNLRIGRTRVLSNPRGYVPSDISPGFDPALVVEV